VSRIRSPDACAVRLPNWASFPKIVEVAAAFVQAPVCEPHWGANSNFVFLEIRHLEIEPPSAVQVEYDHRERMFRVGDQVVDGEGEDGAFSAKFHLLQGFLPFAADANAGQRVLHRAALRAAAPVKPYVLAQFFELENVRDCLASFFAG
jgi:hypothetical protein